MPLRRRFLALLALALLALLLVYFYAARPAPPTRRIPATALATCIGHSGPVRDLRFSPDGRYLASAGADSTLRVWNPATGRLDHTLRYPSAINCLSYNRDGQYVFTGAADGRIIEWQLYSGTVTRQWPAHTGPVRALALSADGQTLASAGDDQVIHLWNVPTGLTQGTLTGHSLPVHSLAFSADGRRLASAGDDRTVRVWDLLDASRNRVLEDHRQPVRSVAFSPNGEWLASGGDDKSVLLTRMASGRAERRLPARGLECVRSVAYSPDGRRIAAATRDHNTAGERWQRLFGTAGLGHGLTIWIWDVESGELIASLNDSPDDIDAIAFGGNGSLVAGGGADGVVRIWQLAPGK